MLTRQFWTGRTIFVVVDDITSWQTADNPLTQMAGFVEQADQLGLHIIAAADIRNWSYHVQRPGVLGRMVGSLPPVLILDGRRENGPIISGVYAEPQRPGKGLYVTASGTEGCWWPGHHRRCRRPAPRRRRALVARGGQKILVSATLCGCAYTSGTFHP